MARSGLVLVETGCRDIEGGADQFSGFMLSQPAYQSVRSSSSAIKRAVVDSIGQRNNCVKTGVSEGSLNETYVFRARKRVRIRLMEARCRLQ